MTSGELLMPSARQSSEPRYTYQWAQQCDRRISSPSAETPTPSRVPSWCVVDESELSFAFDPPTEVGEPRPPCSGTNSIYARDWYSYSINPESETPADTLIWTPMMQQSIALSLQRTMLNRLSESTENFDTYDGRGTFSLLRNSNATEGQLTTSLGTLYRRISHPDYSQSSSHWVSLTFDFGLGPEARLRMRVRKDVPLRWCSAVIANQLGMPLDHVKDQIALCHPTKDTELDQDFNSTDLRLIEHSVIHVQAPLQ